MILLYIASTLQLMHHISAVIITYNAAATIGTCIDALNQVADEVIIIDSLSTDTTVEICRQKNATVYLQQWLGFGPQKNFGISKAKYNHVLGVDADEILSPELIEKIKALKLTGLADLYSMQLVHNYFGKFLWHGHEKPAPKYRMHNKQIISWNSNLVHEALIIPVDCKAVALPEKIYHYSYQNIAHFITKANNYSSLAAQEMFDKGKKANWFKIMFSPAFTFFHSYIIQGGFLDGRQGFVVARLNAYTNFLKYSKLWELHNKK
jgi:glycosyltransferase involved in cell wall biosynthesis